MLRFDEARISKALAPTPPGPTRPILWLLHFAEAKWPLQRGWADLIRQNNDLARI